MGNYVGPSQVNESDAQMWVLNSLFYSVGSVHLIPFMWVSKSCKARGSKDIKNPSLCVY